MINVREMEMQDVETVVKSWFKLKIMEELAEVNQQRFQAEEPPLLSNDTEVEEAIEDLMNGLYGLTDVYMNIVSECTEIDEHDKFGKYF